MNKRLLYITLFLSIILLQACSGTKKYAKQAEAFQDAGLYKDAASSYLESLRRDPTNLEARVGLRQNGIKVFGDYLDDFFKAKAIGDTRKAVYTYLDAKRYAETLEMYNITVDEPSYIKNDFENLKAEYLASLYNDGKMLLGKGDYNSAKNKLSEIVSIDPRYKDAKDLERIALIEPIYIKAEQAFQQEKYVHSYDLMNQVNTHDPNYKESIRIKQQCLELGTYTVALLSITNTTNDKAISHKIQANLMSALANNNNPFIKIIDRENMEALLAQQKLNLSGSIDEKTAASAGDLLGAKAVLTGKVIEYSTNPGKMQVFDRSGFEAYGVKQFNKATQKEEVVTKYQKANYTEYYQKNEVKLAYQIQLTSLQTGEIIFSKFFDQTNADAMHFAVYEGDTRNLYPAANGVVSFNKNERNQLNQLLSASREVDGTSELINGLLNSSTMDFSKDIMNQLQNYISK
jgi:curli biogenesis system outer membrane secretion channel CsgG